MKSRQFKIACVGLDAVNQRPIISAVGITSSRLDAEFDWCRPELADICIVNVHAVDPETVEAVVIRYAERQNGRVVDLVRPVRAGQLLSALQMAMLEVDRRQARAAAKPKPRRYRGQIVDEEPAKPQEPAPQQAAEPKATSGTGKTIVYRGVRIEA